MAVGGKAGKELLEEGVKQAGRFLGRIFGRGRADEGVEALAKLTPDELVDVARNVRIRPGEVLARGASKTGVPGGGSLLPGDVARRRRLYEELVSGPASRRRQFARQTGRTVPMPEGARPSFTDLRTARLVERGRIGPNVPGRVQRVTEFAARRPVAAGVLGAAGLGAGLAGLGLLRGAPTADMSDEQLLGIISNLGAGQTPEQIVAQYRDAEIARARELYGGLSPELQSELDQQQLAYQEALRKVGSDLGATIGGIYQGPISGAAGVGGAYAAGSQAAQAAAAAPTGTDVGMVTPVSGAAAVTPGAIAAEGAGRTGLENLYGTLSDQELARVAALSQLTGEQAATDLARDYAFANLARRIEDERMMNERILDIESRWAEPLQAMPMALSLGLASLTPEQRLEIAQQAAIAWESMDDTTRAAYAQQGITTAEQFILLYIENQARNLGLQEV